MVKKSKAQIKRMMKRAEARGDIYEPPPAREEAEVAAPTTSGGVGDEQPYFAPAVESDKDEPANKNESASADRNVDSKAQEERLRAARKLKIELEAIEADTSLRSKERRSAKRKAEAIALEVTGVEATKLLAWYEEQSENSKVSDDLKDKKHRRQGNPYIVFIGQLSYDTTKENIFKHIKEHLGDNHQITQSSVNIRLLTDSKTKKSRGMAFVEASDPELLYSLLKLHHTMLDGRRINVERSTGGGRNSENRKSKLKQYRAEQEEHMQSVVAGMMDEYKERGEIQEGELDEVAISVCQRHSAAIVSAALEKYVESNGREMDNPSAFFTFLLGKLAAEGICEDHGKNGKDKKGKNKRSFPARNDHSRKRPTTDLGTTSGFRKEESVLSKQGIDMQTSSSTGEPDLGKIFPSMSRGRGRGRGTS